MTEKPAGLTKWIQSCGYRRRSNLFWSWYEPRNFGDWIGPYLFHRLAGETPQYCSKDLHPKRGCLFTAGSILRHLRHPNCVTVWGSGVISRNDSFARPRRVLAVRGPETRNAMLRLGYECPPVYGDPGVLLPLLIAAPPKQPGQIGIIPHFVEYADYKKLEGTNVRVIDVCRPVEVVVSEIASCELTYSSSLHGLIVSHAFGLPSIWMASSKPLDGDDVKFEDYFASCNTTAKRRSSLLQKSFDTADEVLATEPSQEELRRSLIGALPDGWEIR